MIKIISGADAPGTGGSTQALVNLTNALNSAGYDTVYYGVSQRQLNCKFEKLSNLTLSPTDIVISHYLKSNKSLNVKKTILSCHEKIDFNLAAQYNYWDIAVFLNNKQREYHKDYNGKYVIIPNFNNEELKNIRKSPEVEKIAGVIGTICNRKQPHISIKRALDAGFDKVILFGKMGEKNYYDAHIKPLLGSNVIEHGYAANKQQMYDMIGAVFMSSVNDGESATLVKDECRLTGTKFFGNDATDHDGPTLSNDEILKLWIDLIERDSL